MEEGLTIFGVSLIENQILDRRVHYQSVWSGVFLFKVFRRLICSTFISLLSLSLPREVGSPGDVVPCTDGLDHLSFFGLFKDSQNLFLTESTALRVLRSFFGSNSSLKRLLFLA